MAENSPQKKFISINRLTSRELVKGNIQIISWRANRIKSDGTPDEWIKIAKWCQKEDVKKKLDKNNHE